MAELLMLSLMRYGMMAVFVIFPAITSFEQYASAQTEPSRVLLTADNVYFDEDTNTVTAEGNVEAKYEDRIMRADRLTYDRVRDIVRASGNITIIDPDGTQRFADEFQTDSSMVNGFAIGFSTRMPNGGLAMAESAVRTADGLNSLDKIVYTSCDMCADDQRPTWALRARRATLDQESNMYSYRDAVLEVAGVPVIYLPYFAHPDPDSGRRSGFLAPDFGTSSKLGLFLQQPYFWALSPSQEVIIAPKVMGNANPLLDIDYRKRFWSGQVNTNFSFTNEQDFDSDGKKFGDKEWRGHLFADGRFDITPNWEWGFGIEKVSDDLFLRRYDIEGENSKRGLYYGQPLRLLSQIYLQGQEKDWYFDATLIEIDGLRANDDEQELSSVSPLLFAERLFDFNDLGLLSVNGSATLLNRDEGIDSHRVSLGSDWSNSYVLNGGLVLAPFAEARYDHYDLNDTVTNASTVERSAMTAGARISYPLYKAGDNFDLIFEPMAMAAFGTPGANSNDIPVEDSIAYNLDESRLFDGNGIGGYDLFEGGHKASLGVSATALWKNGVSITAIGGRRWRNESDPNFTNSSNLDGTTSDWMTGIAADLGRPLRFETRLQLDDEDLSVNRIDARLSTQWWRLFADLRYYKISEEISRNGRDDEGLSINGQVRLSDEYYFVYSRERDISGRVVGNMRQSARDLRHAFGIAYEDDCSRFEISFERSQAIDRTLGPNDSLKFRFSLKTLGDFARPGDL